MSFVEHPIDWDDAKISRLWNYYARTPPYCDLYFAKEFGEQILQRSRLPLAAAIEVLDFGCGPGFVWDHLVRLGARWFYSGVDFSTESIDRLLRKAHGHAQFRGAKTLTRLPLDMPGNRFDAVLMIEVIEHLNRVHFRATLTEVARVLKRGGVIVITTPNEEDLSKSTKFCPECGAIYHEWQHVYSWNVRDLVEQLEQYGFVLRFARTLDFAARGWFRRFARMWRFVFGVRATRPHMIAVFQKV